MKLLNYDNFELKVSEEALLIRPIRKLWNQDRSEKKEKFFQQMSYLYFMVDPRSTYSYLLDKEARKQAIIEQEGLPANFKPSELLQEAMDIYAKHTITISQGLLRDSMVAANKVSEFLRTVDLNAVDDKGRPRYQVSTITAALKNVDGIITTIQSLTKKVEQEITEQNKNKGSQALTVGDLWAEQGV